MLFLCAGRGSHCCDPGHTVQYTRGSLGLQSWTSGDTAWATDQLTLILQWLWMKGDLVRHCFSWTSSQSNTFSCEINLESLTAEALLLVIELKTIWQLSVKAHINNSFLPFLLLSSGQLLVMSYILLLWNQWRYTPAFLLAPSGHTIYCCYANTCGIQGNKPSTVSIVVNYLNCLNKDTM